MNIKALLAMAKHIEVRRQGNYTTITCRDGKTGNQKIVLAYSYETLIGAIDTNGKVWQDKGFTSFATEQHKLLFCKDYGVEFKAPIKEAV